MCITYMCTCVITLFYCFEYFHRNKNCEINFCEICRANTFKIFDLRKFIYVKFSRFLVCEKNLIRWWIFAHFSLFFVFKLLHLRKFIQAKFYQMSIRKNLSKTFHKFLGSQKFISQFLIRLTYSCIGKLS